LATADRVLSILALFNGDKWQWSVDGAAEAMNLPTSTTYRYFKSLLKAELLSPQGSGLYVLGPGICELDRSMRLHDPFINASRTEMRNLITGNPGTISLLTRLYKGKVLCVHRDGTALSTPAYERGRPMPLARGAASKVLLANLTPRVLRTISSNEPELSQIELGAMGEELARIKAAGYSITRGEIDPGKVGLSVPVFRGNNELEGSLSLVAEASDDPDEPALIQSLIRARKAIEANLLLSKFQSSGDNAGVG